MAIKVWIVMRDEGVRSDGYYYESDTSIIGIRETKKDALNLLNEIRNKLHPDEEPELTVCPNDVPTRFEYHICDDLYDVFWIYEGRTGPAGDNIPEK